MNSVLNFSKVFLLIVITQLIFTASKSGSIVGQSFLSERIVGEGTVIHIWGSHTAEISYHSGYILKNPDWIIPPPERIATVFLEPLSLVKNFQDEKVRVEGLLTKIPGEKINDYTFIASYYVIMVDTIYCIE